MMADLLSRSNQVQSTEWSLHPQVSSCRSIRLSSESQSSIVHISSPSPTCLGHRCSEFTLNINWLGLTVYAYPSTTLLHRVIQKNRKSSCLIILIRDALVLEPSAALNGDPTPVTGVNNPRRVPLPSISQ